MVARIKIENTFRTNNLGEVFYVLEYVGSGKYLIEFQDDFKHRCVVRANRIFEGRPKNPYYRGFKSKGYIGVGEYVSSSSGKEAYCAWACIWRRIQEPDLFPTYTNCYVSEDWENFQNFAKWYYKNYREGWVLDKDIIFPGNRCYGKEFCAYIPVDVNSFFTSKRGTNLPRGVTETKSGKYLATVGNEFGDTRLGIFDTPDEAHLAYISGKNAEAIRLAEKYKDSIDPRVYDRLMNFDFAKSFNSLLEVL